MALKGQLHDFNLSEILQLIATQQKSGFLELEGRHQMVFVFDKGVLVSTRDRRRAVDDPLETYLRNYGFFSDDQWSHVAYIRKNSSLDLDEILVSEGLMTQQELEAVLQGVAREMAHCGMKMRRGRYNFTAIKDSPQGVRCRIGMDVQGLLMEAARRVDEDGPLRRALPTQHITFAQGPTPPPPDGLSPPGRRIIKLALGGRPLGSIIPLARTDSFTTRELLKTFVDQGWLTAIVPESDMPDAEQHTGRRARPRRRDGLRQPLFSMLVLVALLGVGAFRWTPLMLGEEALIGLAEPVASMGMSDGEAAAVSWLDGDQLACRSLRLRQVEAVVDEAVRQYHGMHGQYPEALEGLVAEGMLAESTRSTVASLGWEYAPVRAGQAYRLEP